MTTNIEMWKMLRSEGKGLLKTSPRFETVLENLLDSFSNLKKGDRIFVKPEVKTLIRRDILLREKKYADLDSAFNYIEENSDKYEDFSIPEIDWLDKWSMCYLIACNGNLEVGGKASPPAGIEDLDYLLYSVIGGLPTEPFQKDYPNTPYCIIFPVLKSFRRRRVRLQKDKIIRDYLRRHPDGDGDFYKNKLPPSFIEISKDIEYHELMSFWRHHRYYPKKARKGIKTIIGLYQKANNGDLPKTGMDCLSLIRESKEFSGFEDRILSGIDRRLETLALRAWFKGEQDARQRADGSSRVYTK